MMKMNKYEIYYEATGFVYADTEEEAMEKAEDLPYMDARTRLDQHFNFDNIEIIDCEENADDCR